MILQKNMKNVLWFCEKIKLQVRKCYVIMQLLS